MASEWEISDRLDEPYRLRRSSQFALYFLLLLAWGFILIQWNLIFLIDKNEDPDFTLTLLAFLFVATLAWPIIIKESSPLYRSISNGLFVATILPAIVYIVEQLIVEDPNLASVGLTLASIEILGVQMYQFTNRGAMSLEDLPGKILYAALTSLYWAAMAIFLIPFDNFVLWFFGSVILTMFFVYAILPEGID
jgi:hypothetical protein